MTLNLETNTPVFGLVLAGGHSRRMQKDKSALTYHEGRTQAEYLYSLLQKQVERVFVSCREEQAEWPHLKLLPQIHDFLPSKGPLGGLWAAMEKYPNVAWIILACDMPFFDERALEQLLKWRNPDKMATAFWNQEFSWPEPLCALYERKSRLRLEEFLGQGKTCARKFLMNLEYERIDLNVCDQKILSNVNTPEELSLTMEEGKGEKEIQVHYFANMRELAGRLQENIFMRPVNAWTPSQLYAHLKAKYQFPLEEKNLRVAVNDQFVDMEWPLKDKDKVVFIPPVAGG